MQGRDTEMLRRNNKRWVLMQSKQPPAHDGLYRGAVTIPTVDDRIGEEDDAMNSSGASDADPLTATTRLTGAGEAANPRLYHAVTSGQDLPSSVRDPIIKARAAIEHGQALSDDEEG